MNLDKGTITLVIAVVGAVTGILGLIFNFLNTWRAFDRDKIKLKVIPKMGTWIHPTLGSEQMLCVEVINEGFVPVTLDRVGFPMDGMDQELFLLPHPLNKVNLPVRLEPRESVTIYAPSDLHLFKRILFCVSCEGIYGVRKKISWNQSCAQKCGAEIMR